MRPQARLVCSLVSLAVLLTVTALPGQDVEFRRGDSNIDSRLDISDAVTIIGYLFLGDPERLPCEDAADINDDSRIDLADPIFFLGFLCFGHPKKRCSPTDETVPSQATRIALHNKQ